MQMYSLTAMTGREAAASRTVVIGTIEFNWRVWMIIIWTSPVGMILAAMFWPLIGQYAVFLVPVVPAAAIFLIHRRTRDGLRVATYRAIWDKRKATTNEFLLCGVPVDVSTSGFRQIVSNTVAYTAAPASAPTALATDWVDAHRQVRGKRAADHPVRPATGFTTTDDPAEAARQRRAAAAETAPAAAATIEAWAGAHADAFGVGSEPARDPAPAPMAFAPAHASATAHIAQPDPAPARLDAAYIGREGIEDVPDVATFFETHAPAGHRKAPQ